MSSPFEVVSTYFFAKDGNRPHLMRRVFTDNANVEMIVNNHAISFPESIKGLCDIQEVLGRRFADDFENVYTFGLTQPTAANRHHFPCHWLVGMSTKRSGSIRIGCGRYDWYFAKGKRCLAERLIINIDMMCVFSETELDRLMDWVANLPYPWCTSEKIVSTMPSIEDLTAIKQYLNEIRNIPAE